MNSIIYLLSKYCFVCRAQGYWIILSTKLDKYLCVPHDDLSAIGNRLHGWQTEDIGAPRSVHADGDALIASLITNGIITDNPKKGKPFSEPDYALHLGSVETAQQVAPTSVSLLCTMRFFLACARVDWRLRMTPFFWTLARIERRRTTARTRTVSLDQAHALTSIAVFRRLRPLYPRPYLCLFESLALLEFLAAYHFFPNLVFGVIGDPFQAHCWLQYRSVVLNDDAEVVSRYKPILRI
ncbi:MAG: lasso peptide biosynthesis B2 protein [Pseudomonadota bacterium]|nr:lasso peptide biosynthesis B2 protein [Pseudomonadota bacterium]